METMTERERALLEELLLTREVWNGIIHDICHGFDPPSSNGRPHPGSDRARLREIFAVMDGEVRTIGDRVRALGLSPDRLSVEAKTARMDEALASILSMRSHRS